MPLEPIVSVLMTAYNREKYIAAAIESVLASTLTNFELIIVDDGSKDNTVAIAKSYAEKDARVKLYINEKNLGDYFNRNKAASYAVGKYLKYVDSDDLIYPYGLEVFVNSMERFPDAALGVASFFGQEETPYPFVLAPAEAYEYNFYKKGVFETGPSGLIFNTAKFREIGGFSGKRYVGDTEINMKLAAKWPVVRIAASLVFWRQHEGQEIVAGMQSTGYLEYHLPMYEAALTQPGCPLPQQKRNDILKYHRKVSAREIIKMALLKMKFDTAAHFYKKLHLGPADLLNAIIFRKKTY